MSSNMEVEETSSGERVAVHPVRSSSSLLYFVLVCGAPAVMTVLGNCCLVLYNLIGFLLFTISPIDWDVLLKITIYITRKNKRQ